MRQTHKIIGLWMSSAALLKEEKLSVASYSCRWLQQTVKVHRKGGKSTVKCLTWSLPLVASAGCALLQSWEGFKLPTAATLSLFPPGVHSSMPFPALGMMVLAGRRGVSSLTKNPLWCLAPFWINDSNDTQTKI